MSSQSKASSSSSQSGRSASSPQSSFVTSPLPNSTSISQQAPSHGAPSSALTPSRAAAPSSGISSVSASTPRQSLSTSFPSPNLSSGSVSLSSTSQTPSHAAIANAQAEPLSHRRGIIAAIAASTVAVLLTLLIVFFICRRRRRRMRQMQVGSSTSQQPIMQECPLDRDTKPRPWNDSLNSASTTGSGWPDASEPRAHTTPLFLERQTRRSVTSLPGAMKVPHYTVRSHASMSDVYGFGQDLAWQESHYEEPLPAVPPRPIHPESTHPTIGVVPPTPPSGIVHHDVIMPGATPLLRNPSAASTVSSAYSTASMVLPAPSLPLHIDTGAPGTAIHDRSLTDRDWIIDTSQNVPPEAQPRRLI